MSFRNRAPHVGASGPRFRVRHAVDKIVTVSTLSLALFIAGASAAEPPKGSVFTGEGALAPDAAKLLETAEAPVRYIVVFREPSVAGVAGGQLPAAAARNLPAIPRNANGRANMRSAEALAYAEYLRGRQDSIVSAMSQSIGRRLTPSSQMQHALNAVVVEMTTNEASVVAAQEDVQFVEVDRELPLLTDRGPVFIGANNIWNGAATGVSTRGEGTVVGIIDSGINFSSPSFAAQDPSDGYVHANPLGSGTFLGQCLPAGVDFGACNDKLVGLYDFAYAAACTPASPATDPCRPGGTVIEEPSAVDNNGHGTHTAGTTAGNRTIANFAGGAFLISGVAHRANVIAYDSCHQPVGGQGSCFASATTNAVNRAVQDGIVDALSYSIGGGTSPWTDSTSLAFLGAHNAGIVVSAAAGNDGPTAGTASHLEPWTITSASVQHDVTRAFRFDMTAPTTPPLPGNTQNITVVPGSNTPDPIPTSSIVNAPLIRSPGFANGANDGCNAPVGTPFPADFFRRPATPAGTPGLAVLRLDGAPGASLCASGERRANALAAGAVGVIFVDTTYLNLGASGTSFAMLSSDWANLETQIAAGAPDTATATITAPVSQRPRQGDVMAASSSRGPVPSVNVIKPEIAAPGVGILAPYAGAPNSVNSISGTSMATPHNTGAALLLRALNPTWTPTQIKTALMTTAFTGVVQADGSSPTNAFDIGGGRTRVDLAARAGLIMDETGANFTAANPAAATPGRPQTLNLPSIADSACIVSCVYTRTVRNALGRVVTYTATVSGLGGAGSVSPTSFTLSSTGQRALNVTVNALDPDLSSTDYTFGELVLTPSDPGVPTQRMPIAIRISPPIISLTSGGAAVPAAGFSSNQAQNTTTTRTLNIANIGNPTLNWSVSTGTPPITAYNSGQTTSGLRIGVYPAPPSIRGGYYLQPFDVLAGMQLTRMQAFGFVNPSGGLTAANTPAVTFRIYPGNAAGTSPTGAPSDPSPFDATPGSIGVAPLYAYTAAPTAANGISISGNNPVLDLTVPGVPQIALQPGRYWYSVTPHMNSPTLSPSWFWRSGTAAAPGGVRTVVIGSLYGIPTSFSTVGGVNTVAGTVNGNAFCTQPSWASYSVTSGALAQNANQNTVVTFDSTGIAPGTHTGTLCIGSNDTANPFAIVPLTLNVQLPLSAVGAANPSPVIRGNPTLLTATVTPSTFPASTGLQVRANLTQLGGSASQPLFDDGTNGDVTVGDNVFSYSATPAPTTALGTLALPLAISDAQGRTATASIALDVTAEVPTGVASVAPTSAAVGETVLYTVVTTPAPAPPSTGITVTANFVPIGGSANQVLYDDGTNGDVGANDGTFSANVVVAAGTTLGSKALVATIRDAQLRSSTATANLQVVAGTSPSGTGLATPASVVIGGTSLLTVNVTSGTNPASTGIAVAADLSGIGGSNAQGFRNDGQQGDVAAGDAIWSYNATIPAGTTPGAKTLPATITDAQSRSGTTSIALTVQASVAPTGVGSATPASVSPTESSLLTVAVTPGSGPASTGLAVSVDLSSIGGSPAQAMVDDGSGGDATASDNVFSYAATVPAGTPAGAKSLTATISDAQSRTSTANIALTVGASTPLMASGVASPNSVLPGGATLVTVDVTPATGPASTGIAVAADLTSIGGSATQALFDDGTNGDVTAADNTFSFNATVAAATATGLKSIAASATDAQARSANVDIALNVGPGAALIASGSATPNSVGAGGSSLLTVAVTAATGPASTGITVTADLTSIGGSATQALLDDGMGGDATAGDGIYSFSATVAGATPVGLKTIAVSVADAQARTASTSISLNVQSTVGSLLAIARSVPPVTTPSGTTVVRVTVTPATGPASTGIAVRIDLTSIGGSATQAMFDDGTNGDTTAGDNVFSYQATVAAATPLGFRDAIATASDAQGRTGTASTTIEVRPVEIFRDQFE